MSKAVEYIQTSTPMTPDLESNVIARKETQAEGIVIDDTADFVKEQQTPVKARECPSCLCLPCYHSSNGHAMPAEVHLSLALLRYPLLTRIS